MNEPKEKDHDSNWHDDFAQYGGEYDHRQRTGSIIQSEDQFL